MEATTGESQMSKLGRNNSPLYSPPKLCDVQISVEQFGPIRSGSVGLRPLTIFVGPSNTGKTYLAILIYALHRVLHGFPRLPVMERYLFSDDDNLSLSEKTRKRLIETIRDDRRPTLFSDVLSHLHEWSQSIMQKGDFLSEDLRNELERCFDLKSVASLVRMGQQDKSANLALAVNEEGRNLWNFLMNISGSDISTKGNINEIELLFERSVGLRSNIEIQIDRLRNRLGVGSLKEKNRRITYLFYELWDTLVHNSRDHHVESCYLPAARSGIMQSHRVIASSLVSRSTRAGLERFPELPTFSGVIADFMQTLILYDVPSPYSRFRRRRKRTNALKSLANILEERTLGGRILARESSPGAYPEFVYRPEEAKEDIQLSRASSMVSELAPVVLFMRNTIRRGDTLIIEEPEAHLHPAAQTEMAIILVRLGKCGVRVVVTTHSDWFLKEIGNLMLEGELEEHTDNQVQDKASDAIRPKDVGIWLFQNDASDDGSTIQEIKFDRVNGIEPSDYESISEGLYNRSADLQNRLEEVKNKIKT